MKTRYLKQAFFAIFLAGIASILFFSCQKDKPDSLGPIPQASFTVTPITGKTNTYLLQATSTPSSFVYQWDKGDGSPVLGNATDTAYFPDHGEYIIKLLVLGQGGYAVADSQKVVVATDDPNGCTGPKQLITDCSSKTWVMDQYNNFAKEVAAATGLNIIGHMGLGPSGSYDQSWWGAGANEKNTWTLYNYKYTFDKIGSVLKIVNSGDGYGRKAAAASVGGFAVTSTNGDDAFFPYNGGTYTFSVSKGAKYPKITLSGNAFLGYYCGNQTYDIVYLTDKVMALRVDDYTESQDWVFVYCREDLNVAPPPVVKPLRAVPLSEGFENSPLSITFSTEDMGANTGVVDNPLPLPINTSAKVYRYQKSEAFYGNVYWVTSDYKFDLKNQNKIKIKVFIPSYNNYTTNNTVAGDWITNAKLLPQLSIKLQNGDLGGNAWTTQTEIIKGDLPKDQWVQLTYDFSSVADRADYNKIVIQFGAEGHAGTGFFYFDDFLFSE